MIYGNTCGVLNLRGKEKGGKRKSSMLFQAEES